MKEITVKQYAALKPDQHGQYDTLYQIVNPKNQFAKKEMPVSSISYTNVKYCYRLMRNTDWNSIQQLFEICYDVPAAVFWKAKISEYMPALKFLIEWFGKYAGIEKKLFTVEPGPDDHIWKLAGADRLKPYNDTLPLVHLGKMFGMYPNDLGRKPYLEVLSLQAQIKASNEVEFEFQKLKSK